MSNIYDYLPSLKVQEGMTLRDYFAAKAMQATLSNNVFVRAFNNEGKTAREAMALTAYHMADAMLAERAKNDTQTN